MPSEQDVDYGTIGIELLRVDMQVGWGRNQPTSLREYQARYPKLLQDVDRLAELAFEEYRMRRIAGQQVTPEFYSKRYSVQTGEWPRVGDSTVRIKSAAANTVFEHIPSPASARTADLRSDQNTEQDARQKQTITDGTGNDVAAQLTKVRHEKTDLPQVGDRFSGFDLLCEIGVGAFAHVFLAKQHDLANRHVVLKITASPNTEPQQLARLQHTHVVPINSVHHASGLQAVCMPYFGPCTLNDALQYIQDRAATSDTAIPDTSAVFASSREARTSEVKERLGPLSSEHTTGAASRPSRRDFEIADRCATASTPEGYVDACVHIGWQIARALNHAHSQGIVHRDLKPANVLLADHGPTMLLDFNLSDEPEFNRTASFNVGGTLPYAAPENLESLINGRRVGIEADLYSLGVILYQLLTLHLPFPVRPGTSDLTIREMICDRKSGAVAADKYNSNLPPSLIALVEKLLSNNPRDRYQNADELSDDLRRHLEHRPLRHVPNLSLLERMRKWRRRHPVLASTAVLATLSLGTIAILLGFMFASVRASRQLRLDSIVADVEQAVPSVRAYTSVPNSDLQLLERGLVTARQAIRPLERECDRQLSHGQDSRPSRASEPVVTQGNRIGL